MSGRCAMVAMALWAIVGCRFDGSGVWLGPRERPPDDAGDGRLGFVDGQGEGVPDGPSPDTHADAPPDAPAPDTSPPDAPPDVAPDVDPGRWHQANFEVCGTFCAGLGRANVPGPEEASCMSGEVRPKSGVDQGIDFKWGCWPNCSPQTGALPASSTGKFCYRPGQSKDDNLTDRTVGCFCQ